MSPAPALVDVLADAPSATDALARHIGAPHLSLGDVRAQANYRLTERDRALLTPPGGIVTGYQRDAVLRTPQHRPVAQVHAVVLTGLLDDDSLDAVVRAARPLGQILIAAGYRRRNLTVRRTDREDFTGERITLTAQAVFEKGEVRVAHVREEVYAWAAAA